MRPIATIGCREWSASLTASMMAGEGVGAEVAPEVPAAPLAGTPWPSYAENAKQLAIEDPLQRGRIAWTIAVIFVKSFSRVAHSSPPLL